MIPDAHNILLVEDDAIEVEMIRLRLENDQIPCSLHVVHTRAEFSAAMEIGGIDIVLADYSIPGFDGMEALAIARERWKELPFIMISGIVGEESAVDALKSGATDYIMKDRMSRLGPSVKRAIDEIEARRESRNLREQATRAQKMEIFGHLAGGLAHDFNNILTVIMANSGLILQKLQPGSPIQQYAEQIEHSAGRASALVRQLLIFSRHEPLQPVVLDLNNIVEGTLKLLHRLLPETIELKVAASPHAAHIQADRGCVEQVLMNLVINARDALPTGGKITLATGRVSMEGENAVPGGEHYISLTVSDTGFGMTEAIKARLFEPFFTTKPEGVGTGLGLVTCQRIISEIGGCILAESEQGKGTTFTILIPEVDMPLSAQIHMPADEAVPSGSETLLIVEDDPAVRHLAVSLLQARGFEVLSAGTGKEALDILLAERDSPIRLVITDVIMPQMSGQDLARAVASTAQGVKVLFTSGYSDDTIAPHGVLRPGVRFLRKPYTQADLVGKVREILDEPQRKRQPELSRGASKLSSMDLPAAQAASR